MAKNITKCDRCGKMSDDCTYLKYWAHYCCLKCYKDFNKNKLPKLKLAMLAALILGLAAIAIVIF